MIDEPVGEVHIEADKSDLHQLRVVTEPIPELAPGQVLLAVDHFGLTANNITYAAVAGDLMGYWRFFPAADGWGRVPTWGFADVVASADDRVQPGARLYGYLPMGTHLVLTPGVVTHRDLVDAAPHRAELPPAYNSYRFVASDPVYDPERERQQMVLLPLFFTSFVLDDSLVDAAFHGADTVVLSSASSKTAIGTAFLLAERGAPAVIGLTSARHAAAVRALGVYDDVLPYEEAPSLPGLAAVYLDFSGSTEVRRSVHERYGDALAHSSVIGGTHWDAIGGGGELRGPDPVFFFAPDRIRARTTEWGRDELDRRLAAAWSRFSAWTDGWLSYRDVRGPDAVRAAFVELLDGRVGASEALVCTVKEQGP